MPTWTISAPIDFQESVKETANKLGLGYGEYLRKAHRDYLGKLTSKDFERAKKLMEMDESKKRLGSLRERETLLLREKGYKDKNVQRILRGVEDSEIKDEIERLAALREEEADTQIRLHEELNPTGRKRLGQDSTTTQVYGHTLEEWRKAHQKPVEQKEELDVTEPEQEPEQCKHRRTEILDIRKNGKTELKCLDCGLKMLGKGRDQGE